MSSLKSRVRLENLASKKGIKHPHLLNYYFQTIYYIEDN